MNNLTRKHVAELVFEQFPLCVEIEMDEIVSTATQRAAKSSELEIRPERQWELRMFFRNQNFHTLRAPSLQEICREIRKTRKSRKSMGEVR